VDGVIVHVFRGKCCAVELKTLVRTFEVTVFSCILESFPDKVDGEEWILQRYSASWGFASVCLCESLSGQTQFPVIDGNICQKESNWEQHELKLVEHLDP